MEFTNYKFKYGKSYSDSNVYIFSDGGNELKISEKVGRFINGDSSQYLLFEYQDHGFLVRNYVDKKSSKFLETTNIRPIINNLNNIVVQCTGCNTIVLKEQITSAKADKCIYCDMYICKKCKKFFPLAQLDDNRLCERCRDNDHD